MKARFRWRAWKARFRDQRAELAVIRREIRRGQTVCDIGANKGSFTYWLAKWAWPGRVVAFEPQAELAEYVRLACQALGLTNVTVEAKAVHARSGVLSLFIPGEKDSPGATLVAKAAAGAPGRSIEVPVVSLDEYFPADVPISVLKVDVEGAERGVFEGAQRILRQYGPLLVFECENRHLESGSVHDVFAYLEQFGYQGSFVCGSRLRPLAEFDAAIHQRNDGERFWDAKDYCNNFVFRKA